MRPINFAYFFGFYCLLGCVTITDHQPWFNGNDAKSSKIPGTSAVKRSRWSSKIRQEIVLDQFTSFCLKLSFQGKWREYHWTSQWQLGYLKKESSFQHSKLRNCDWESEQLSECYISTLPPRKQSDKTNKTPRLWISPTLDKKHLRSDDFPFFVETAASVTQSKILKTKDYERWVRDWLNCSWLYCKAHNLV